jgi:Cd2+/Zn2+-exporting ATPase
VLIKGGSALEQARSLRAIALDKTGTLTEGKPTLVLWQADERANAEQTAQAAAIAWQLASRSDHPVSRAIATGLQRQLGQSAVNAATAAEAVQALPGRGVEGLVNGQRMALGNLRLMREMGLADDAIAQTLLAQEEQGRTVTLLASERAMLAWFAVADPLRDTSREAVRMLQAEGVTPVVLSGDNPATVRRIASEAGIADARGGLLPQDKLDLLKDLRREHGPVAMSGDGINDAPALAAADIGFAMGGAHSTAMAMETAQIVLMNDDLRRIPDTVRLSRDAHRVLWQNITLALGIKAVFFALALMGMASMWMAVAADMGVSLLVVANGLRLRRWD